MNRRLAPLLLAFASLLSLALPLGLARASELSPQRAVTLHFNASTAPMIWAETACDARSWARGLQHRDELMPNHGMLFVFPQTQNAPFWMKDTRIALDAGFLGEDGRLVEVISMPPCTREPCPLYAPRAAYRYVLEMRAGWFAEHGLRPGMQLATKALQHACRRTPAAP
ncbi:MAG: DUF192 domain-containing protein [Gammaproteobacteria bacterium]